MIKINDKIRDFMNENKKWYSEIDLHRATGNYIKYLSNIPIRTIEDYKEKEYGGFIEDLK